jgi:cell division GTPase FtsZ
MELLRHKVEKMSYFRGTLLFHSLAGGTGSGLGSRLVECYREYFGSASVLMTASVWPSQSGETPLQQYNTCLSLAALQEHADAVLLFQNDQIIRMLDR